MIPTPEQFTTMNKLSFETVQGAARASMSGFERFASLNLQAARSSFEESVAMMKTLLEVKDVKEMSGLTGTALQPAADKFSSYTRHCYEIASETGAELARLAEKQFADGNKQLSATLDTIGRNAPAGSEGVVTLVKSAVTAANTAFDQVTRATRQVVEMAEANVETATKSVNPRGTRKAA